MKTYGDIDLQQNQLMQAVLPVETGFPIGPKTGRILFMNKILYICVEIDAGTPVWIPLTTEINSYSHDQSTASNVWTITHNLKTNNPVVQIYSAVDNTQLIPDTIETIDTDTVQVSFSTPQAGRAIIVLGNQTGTTRQEIAYQYTQTDLSATWVVSHNLGRYPIIRVFIGNNEVQPLSVTHDSVNQVTITFSSPRVGTVRCI